MGESWLKQYKGQRVTALTGTTPERTDTGRLIEIGDGWLQISKDDGEMLLIPSSAIRVIKLLDMAHAVSQVEQDRAVAHLDTHVYDPNTQRI